MAAITHPKSFLDLPCEVRLEIYKLYFQSTTVYVHSIVDPCTSYDLDKQNTYVSLLTVNRLICREATPLFIRVTPFLVEPCECWLREDSINSELPPINNLTITHSFDLATNQGSWDRDEGLDQFDNIMSALRPPFKTNHRMNSLTCQPTVHEIFTEGEFAQDFDHPELTSSLEMILETLIERIPRFVRDLEFKFCLCEADTVLLVNVTNENGNQLMTIQCPQRKHLQAFSDILEERGLQHNKIVWKPNT